MSAAIIGKTAGGVTGYLKQAGTYYVYAQVTDAVSSVSTVTANVSTVTTGSTAVAMTAGSYSAGGGSYNYRSALLTATSCPHEHERCAGVLDHGDRFERVLGNDERLLRDRGRHRPGRVRRADGQRGWRDGGAARER